VRGISFILCLLDGVISNLRRLLITPFLLFGGDGMTENGEYLGDLKFLYNFQISLRLQLKALRQKFIFRGLI